MSSPAIDLRCAPLVRFWMARGLLEPTPPAPDLGARLGAWLDVRQAIHLHQLLGQAADAPRIAHRHGEGVLEQVEQALSELREAISSDRFAPGLWRNPMPTDEGWPAPSWTEFWEPYRRYWVDHQKQMVLVLGRWRRRLRELLSDAGGTAHALAQMDAVMDQALTPRETRWLASMPYRFEQGLLARLHHPPSGPAQAEAFDTDIRQCLLAELQLRSQPVCGLIDAFKSHCT